MAKLTKQQEKILELIRSGKSNSKIAKEVNLSHSKIGEYRRAFAMFLDDVPYKGKTDLSQYALVAEEVNDLFKKGLFCSKFEDVVAVFRAEARKRFTGAERVSIGTVRYYIDQGIISIKHGYTYDPNAKFKKKK